MISEQMQKLFEQHTCAMMSRLQELQRAQENIAEELKQEFVKQIERLEQATRTSSADLELEADLILTESENAEQEMSLTKSLKKPYVPMSLMSLYPFSLCPKVSNFPMSLGP
jgi:hypothetical protein